MSRSGSDSLRAGRLYLPTRVPIFKEAGSGVAADGDILANNLALSPLMVTGDDLSDCDLGRALVLASGRTRFFLAKELHLLHLVINKRAVEELHNQWM